LNKAKQTPKRQKEEMGKEGKRAVENALAEIAKPLQKKSNLREMYVSG
jgi:hypothetical protein